MIRMFWAWVIGGLLVTAGFASGPIAKVVMLPEDLPEAARAGYENAYLAYMSSGADAHQDKAEAALSLAEICRVNGFLEQARDWAERGQGQLYEVDHGDREKLFERLTQERKLIRDALQQRLQQHQSQQQDLGQKIDSLQSRINSVEDALSIEAGPEDAGQDVDPQQARIAIDATQPILLPEDLPEEDQSAWEDAFLAYSSSSVEDHRDKAAAALQLAQICRKTGFLDQARDWAERGQGQLYEVDHGDREELFKQLTEERKAIREAIQQGKYNPIIVAQQGGGVGQQVNDLEDRITRVESSLEQASEPGGAASPSVPTPKAKPTASSHGPAISADPYRAIALFEKGRSAYLASGTSQLATAQQELTAAVQADPENPVFHYYLGLTLHRQGDDQAAVAQVRQGAALEAKNPGGEESVAASLEDIQGPARQWLEGIRKSSR